MEKAAAIDIGSNAIRMVIGGWDDNRRLQIYRKMREPVRLGQDVFEKRLISANSIGAALKTFETFRKVLDEQKIINVRAVATSAVREAANGKEFADIVTKTYGIKIEIIDGIQEAKLIQKAVESEISLSGHRTVLLDIGGGSVEVSIAEGMRTTFCESLPIGTVKLLRMMDKEKASIKDIEKHISTHLTEFSKKITELNKKTPIDLCIGTGGNIECFGVIRAHLFQKNSMSKVYLDELDKIIKKLEEMSIKDRIEKWKLKADRADVIFPAAFVTRQILKISGVETLQIPRVGLREGVLLGLLQKANLKLA